MSLNPLWAACCVPWARNFNLVLLTQVYKWVPAYTGTHDPKVVSLNPVWAACCVLKQGTLTWSSWIRCINGYRLTLGLMIPRSWVWTHCGPHGCVLEQGTLTWSFWPRCINGYRLTLGLMIPRLWVWTPCGLHVVSLSKEFYSYLLLLTQVYKWVLTKAGKVTGSLCRGMGKPSHNNIILSSLYCSPIYFFILFYTVHLWNGWDL